MTHLDANAITEVERLVKQADPIITTHAERRGVYFTRAADGTLIKNHGDLAQLDVQVYDLDSLTRAAEEAVGDGCAAGLYVHDDGVTLVNQTSTERWTVKLPLPTHPSFHVINAWQRPTSLTQRELVRVLRTELSQYVDATLIPTFSSLRMTSSSDGTSTVTPASTALDRKIVKQVQAEQGRDVPEFMLPTPPVYDIPEDRNEKYEVKVYVEFDHEQEKFVLVAVHDDLRRAREKAVERIVSRLRETFEGAVTVLYGKPN